MKHKKFETLIYSAVGVAVMFGIIVAVNLITGAFKARVDLTAEKLYTLSPGTKQILRRLDSPVELRFYSSQRESGIPSTLKTYATHVEDLLHEFKQAARGKLELKKFDPKPDSDAEELAQLDGVEPQMLQTGEGFYLGIAVSQDPQKVALPFLSPEREKLLEYDLARAISQVAATSKTVVGVMTPLPMFGQAMNPMMMQMRQPQQKEDPWVVVTELQKDYEVKQVPMDTDRIEDSIKVLMVVHPKGITDKGQYAIDQFVMRGGKLLAMLDPLSIVDSRGQNPQMMGLNTGGGSNMEKLLKAWGIQFEGTKVVADLNFLTRFMRGNVQDVAPAVLSMNVKGINKEDVVTSQLDNVLLPFAGTFSGTPVPGLKQTVLLKTTTDSQLVDSMMAQMAGQKIIDEFKPSGMSQAVAIRLAGKFKSAFPEGKPEEPENKDDKKTDEKKDAKSDSLKESSAETTVVLIGDADFMYDQFCAQVQNIFGQKIVIPRNGNLNLAQSVVEQLGGDQSLVGARSRSTMNRPFTVVSEMQTKANLRFQSEIAKLQAELEETQRKLNEMQTKKEPGQQRMIISPEQQAAVANFKQQEVKAKKRLKEVRKDLRQDIDSLENRLKWANIAGMPALVTAAGLALALIRKQRTKAK